MQWNSFNLIIMPIKMTFVHNIHENMHTEAG